MGRWFGWLADPVGIVLSCRLVNGVIHTALPRIGDFFPGEVMVAVLCDAACQKACQAEEVIGADSFPGGGPIPLGLLTDILQNG